MDFEIEIIKALQTLSSPAMDLINTIISFFSDWTGLLLVSVLLFFFYKKDFAVYYFGTAGVASIVKSILKAIINRPRPYLASAEVKNIFQALGSSFPSGHSVQCMVTIIFLGIIVKNAKIKNKHKVLCFSGLVLYALVNMFNRMYLGQHYLTDILAGYALAVIVSLIFIFLWPIYTKIWNTIFYKKAKAGNITTTQVGKVHTETASELTETANAEVADEQKAIKPKTEDKDNLASGATGETTEPNTDK